jgi:nucleotide-binding universal stress UspA family protein
MYRKILVPLDGSKRAEAILPHVEELALRYDAEVLFLRVVEPTVSVTELTWTVEQQLIDQVTKDAELYLAGLRGEFRGKGIQVQTLVAFGLVVATILDVAQRESVDLIAMASHGRSGFSRVFYGSVAAGVLHGVDRPLLLIRAANS